MWLLSLIRRQVWWGIFVMFLACAIRETSSKNEYRSFLHDYQQLSSGMTELEVRTVFGEPTKIETESQSGQTWVYQITYQTSNPMTYALWYQQTVDVCDIYLYISFDENMKIIRFSYKASDSCNG